MGLSRDTSRYYIIMIPRYGITTIPIRLVLCIMTFFLNILVDGSLAATPVKESSIADHPIRTQRHHDFFCAVIYVSPDWLQKKKKKIITVCFTWHNPSILFGLGIGTTSSDMALGIGRKLKPGISWNLPLSHQCLYFTLIRCSWFSY